MKKIKIIAGVLALCAIAGVNVWNATVVSRSSELKFENIEMIAEGESENIEKKGVEDPYQCSITATVTFNADGFCLYNGILLSGRANKTETRNFSYTAYNCKGGEGHCKKIRCR